MRGKQFALLLLLHFSCLLSLACGQRSLYSLQAAVDELHRRDAGKYPLNVLTSQQQQQQQLPPSRYFGSPLGTNSNNEQDYWDDDGDSDSAAYLNPYKYRNRHRLNKALAKYLERESYDADHGGLSLGPFGGYEFDEEENNNNNIFLDEKKRAASLFRERDNKYENGPSSSASVFREREIQSTNGGDRAELTEQFLREIEEAEEHERQERYKEALHNLWEKYQEQENEVSSRLFEEKKRMRVPPSYMLMQKKRSYPVLPWLPYSAEKKKRFPVSKRTAKRSPIENGAMAKTVDKIPRELSELFGTQTGDEKQKRSTDTQTKASVAAAATTIAPMTVKVGDMRLEMSIKKNNESKDKHDGHDEHAEHSMGVVTNELHQHGGSQAAGYRAHSVKEHEHRKRSDHVHHSREQNYESDEEAEHEGHNHEHEHNTSEEGSDEASDEHDDEFDEDDEERRKKKRDIIAKRSVGELPKKLNAPLSEMITTRTKKSVDWSKYFGIDRKKKMFKSNDIDMKKRSTGDEDDAQEKKKDDEFNPDKLDKMDKKLQSIEDFIIDETIKYTGAHEGVIDQDEINRLKDHVLSRLATAYSLEKMRRALDKLRQSVENENHLLRNVIEPEGRNDDESSSLEKRLSVKKEQAVNEHDKDSSAINEKSKEQHVNTHYKNSNSGNDDNDSSTEDDMKKEKKKKRNGYLRYPELPNGIVELDDELSTPGRYESFNDAYLGTKNYIIGTNQCPLIESMAERCRGVDLLSGDLNQELLPICGVHQICYLCSTSQVSCDYQYLAEADAICGHNIDCQAAARSVLMILRGTPGPQLGPRECLKNPCLYSAMREIGL